MERSTTYGPVQCGRVSTALMRGLEKKAEAFEGLPHGAGRYDLLNLIKEVGDEIGFTRPFIEHLEFLIRHTRDTDWMRGGRPVIYKSVSKTALELRISERQVNNRERRLHEIGGLLWTGAANHKRSGYRDEAGRIVFAQGVDLSPLADLYDELQERAERRRTYNEDWVRLRRRLSGLKRQARGRIAEAKLLGLDVESFVRAYEGIKGVRATTGLECIEDMVAFMDGLNRELTKALEAVLPAKTSDRSEMDFRHIQDTNQYPIIKITTCNPQGDERAASDEAEVDDSRAKARGDYDRKEKRVEVEGRGQRLNAIADTGVQHVPLSLALKAASPQFMVFLKGVWQPGSRVGPDDLVNAAERLSGAIGISRHAWIDATAVMGGYAAAVAVLIIDRRMNCPENPVRSPGGALRGMTSKALEGDLHLHRSVFGLLERGQTETS